ncbi:uncharacterized protein CTHT_0052910 [Thermochaetoides thermophila DSM 1495]|uniref:Protection of telomeres protein 1 n=1 Tax=Chaetomium thermophilum (strain DSM 1495 / CBS 144.50 / IMI 039719) TaxID=759272 RepID=G0SDT3_CHATD|nr:hypothetical protein CTHT_0052910 [Thermochaetoides thermophila DSM 1495]EGS18684.1 hypothetical protein CTHT_0052910 [Thermochaetoides thermophila DSM 1495]
MPNTTGLQRAHAPQYPAEPPLPQRVDTIRDLLDGKRPFGSLVCVVGLVKDQRLPKQTKGADWKSELTLYDLSIEYENDGIVFSIFRPQADMPMCNVGDIVFIIDAKLQHYNGRTSLITNQATIIQVYKACRIPEWPHPAEPALEPPTRRDKHSLTAEEHLYVSWMYHKIDKCLLPTEEEFQQRAAQSLNVKEKFTLLKDVHEGQFCDLIVEVVREPHAFLDMVTLYVSDYTENSAFHPQAWDMVPNLAGDPYGYLPASSQASKKEWYGPHGKMSLQITCYEPHASFITNHVSAKQWVYLRNVQIKYGRDGKYLEGFMREERNISASRVNVQLMDTTNRDTVDPRLKDAIRRKLEYGKKVKEDLRQIKAAQEAGLKRKASEASVGEKQELNSKLRRQLKRRIREQKEKGGKQNREQQLNLNQAVTCEKHDDVPDSTIESILEPTIYNPTVDQQPVGLLLPFVCAKYQAFVRVVDFWPPNLEDFACSRKVSEFDMISDYDGSDMDSSASCSKSEEDEAAESESRRIWEWRFFLQLEDPTPASDTSNSENSTNKPRPRLWALVDNAEAQCLTGLDACDLRKDTRALATLRERMFTLWGNLEEVKTQVQQGKEQAAKQKAAAARPRHQPPGAADKALNLERPPLDSSDDEREYGSTSGIVNEYFVQYLGHSAIHLYIKPLKQGKAKIK